MVLFAVGCGASTGASIEFKQPADGSVALAGDPSPRLGFMDNGEATAMVNGGRIRMGDGKVAEIFLAPYPPDWQTDLHLFLLDSTTFDPVTNVEVDLDYDMVYMDHGIAGLSGTRLADGHYVMPLNFLMYGDWTVDTTVHLPESKEELQFIVKFLPQE